MILNSGVVAARNRANVRSRSADQIERSRSLHDGLDARAVPARLRAGGRGGRSRHGGARAAGAAPGKIEKPKLTLGLAVPAASFLPVYVAAARTWKEQGLEVEIVSFRGDAEVSQAMAGGSLDLSLQSFDGLINLIEFEPAREGLLCRISSGRFRLAGAALDQVLGRSQGRHHRGIDLRVADRPAHPLRAAQARAQARDRRRGSCRPAPRRPAFNCCAPAACWPPSSRRPPNGWRRIWA